VSQRVGSVSASFRRCGPGPARGFTILELLIALAALTLIAAFSLWAYFTRPEVTLDNAAVLLARDLRIAQNRAILLRRPVHFVFSPEGDGYCILDDAGGGQLSRAGFERIDRRYSRDAIFEGVQIIRAGLAATDRIVFSGRDGQSPSGRIMLSYGDQTRTLEIESGTGKILLTDAERMRGHSGF